MLCVKCGKQTEGEQVFCSRCLESMEKYPVKPDVHIQLPTRPSTVAQKKQSRKQRALSPEEQVVRLRRKLRWSRFCGVVLLLALVLAAGKIYEDTKKTEDQETGKNYTYTEATVPTGTVPATAPTTTTPTGTAPTGTEPTT